MDLSFIIISYNTKELTKACLDGLLTNLATAKGLKSEVIIVDNGSSDGSVEMLEAMQELQDSSFTFNVINNKVNLGFGAANNIGAKVATGKYLLLLNSDTVPGAIYFKRLVDYLNTRPDVGGLTIKVVFPNGNIDPASHRGFPTLWNSLCYYSGFEKLLGTAPGIGKFFGGYHLTHLNINTTHEIDAPAAAFFLIPRSVFTEVGGFDEDYFMYGEDIDLCYRIKQRGYKILYYPSESIIHLKHQSGLKRGNEQTQNLTKTHFYKSMKIFYDKHYAKNSLSLINHLVHFGIDLKQKL